MVRLEQEGVAGGWRVCLKYIKRGWNRKEERGNKDFKKGGTSSRGVCLKEGWNPHTNYYPVSFHTVLQVFKVLKNLLDSCSYIFITNFNVFTQTLTPPHPLNGENLLSMIKNFCCCTLLNYKNESSTNVSKYYRLAIYLANTKHFCGNSIL